MPIQFAVKIVRLKVYIIFSHSDDLGRQWRSQLCLKVDKSLNSYFNSNISDIISAISFKLGTPVHLYMPYMLLMLVPMTLTLTQDHSG